VIAQGRKEVSPDQDCGDDGRVQLADCVGERHPAVETTPYQHPTRAHMTTGPSTYITRAPTQNRDRRLVPTSG